MLTILAAALMLALFPSRAASAPAVQNPTLEAANLLVVRACGRGGSSCADVRRLRDEYAALWGKAWDCVATGDCPAAAITTLYERIWALDEEENALPPAARTLDGGRPLLRLSAACSVPLATALARADPEARLPARSHLPVELPKVIEEICAGGADACDDARAVAAEAKLVYEGAATCERVRCSFEEIDRLALSMQRGAAAYFRTAARPVPTLPLFKTHQDARASLLSLLSRAALERAASLAARTAVLADETAAIEALASSGGDAALLEARLRRLDAGSVALLAEVREAATTVGRIEHISLSETSAGPLRARVNMSSARLGALRARSLAIVMARRLDLSTAPGEPRVLAGAASTLAPSRAPLTLLDPRSAPPLPASVPRAPASAPAGASWLQNLRDMISSDLDRRAEARRRVGLTRTIGDPVGRAGLVHQQDSPTSCAIVAQQQILLAHGLLSKDEDPKIQEASLALDAELRGFYRYGTPDAYGSSLLVERGLLVVREKGVELSVLDAAVRRGGMVIAAVDARHLWNASVPMTIGHAVVITGAEISRLSGATVGYYINDSGAPTLGAGRFVPVERFQKAWDGFSRTFSEVR